ncbi:MAG: ATP-binding protein [Pirellulaceae bacterium]
MSTSPIPNPQSPIPNPKFPISLLGHDAIAERFRRSIARGRLASTFLFVGPPGVGKRTFAVWLAQALLCSNAADGALGPFGVCPSCQQVVAGTHPDLEMIRKPQDRAFIPVELFIGDREHRMREGLCHNISLKPFAGGRKIAIIDDADHLNQEGANCLLKTLEEPPPASLIILVGTSEQTQLPTLRSRCQIVRFGALRCEDVAHLLLEAGVTRDPQEAAQWAQLGEGSVQQAIDLADLEFRDFREQLLRRFAGSPGSLLGFASDVNAFVDQAGKEAPARRDRLRHVVRFAADFYRSLMLGLSGLPARGDAALVAAIQQGLGGWQGDATVAAACLDRCFDTEGHIASNASLALVVECWLDELGQIARRA